MKKVFSWGVMALLASITTAQAADPIIRDSRIFRFDFSCQFENHKDAATGVVQDVKGDEFEAAARVFARVPHHGSGSTSANILDDAIQVKSLRNLLAVARDGNLFYADGALLDSGKRKVIIAAATGQRLAIEIPRHDRDSVSAEWMKHKAFLVIDNRVVPGNCNVRARPIERGHEYDEENQGTEQYQYSELN